VITTSIESLREAQEEIAGQWKGSLLYSMVADGITELETARERITLLQIQTAQYRSILLDIRKIAAFIPGDIGAKLTEALASLDEIEANERKIEALAKREATE